MLKCEIYFNNDFEENQHNGSAFRCQESGLLAAILMYM